jgi:hypothetical protein
MFKDQKIWRHKVCRSHSDPLARLRSAGLCGSKVLLRTTRSEASVTVSFVVTQSEASVTVSFVVTRSEASVTVSSRRKSTMSGGASSLPPPPPPPPSPPPPPTLVRQQTSEIVWQEITGGGLAKRTAWGRILLVFAIVVTTVLLHERGIVDVWQQLRSYGPSVCLAGGATFVLVTLARCLYERRMLSDFGKVNSVNHMTVFRPTSVEALRAFLQQNTGRLAIKGGGYSHGGHVLVEGGTQIDMDLLNAMTYHPHNQTVRVVLFVLGVFFLSLSYVRSRSL